MARGKRFLSLTIIMFTSIATSVGSQQDKTTSTSVQNVKSAMRRIYEEDQKDRADEAGDPPRSCVKKTASFGSAQSFPSQA
jgi:hypothetical protein